MKMETDSKNNKYIDLDNIRLTLVKGEKRKPEKDWYGSDVLRIQAYKGTESSSLHMGAEIPIESKEKIIELVQVLLRFYKEF